jgi:tRNA threonylcarbamoyladenosine biosynthesis protein TsaE
VVENTEKFICRLEEETFRLGEWLGKDLRGGEVILLSGGLGAGKTLFTKGVLSALELDPADVTSPSFTLVNRYEARLRVYHIDLYRLAEDGSAAFAVGLDDILNEEGAVTIIEWAERLGNYKLPEQSIKVGIVGAGDDSRTIEVTKPEDKLKLEL